MIAVVFPGQGSQVPGMGQDLHDSSPEARQIFVKASEATGRDVAALCFDSDEATLRQTQNAQIALYTSGLAAWCALRAKQEIQPVATAGHSVGEYAALAAAGVFSVEDGALLVQKRGEIMAKAGDHRKGTMAAVIGMQIDTLESVCESVSDQGVAVIANDNCPGQLVISGDYEAVQAASAEAQDRGARRIIPLNVSGAFHSPLMDEPAEEFKEVLTDVTFNNPQFTVWSNVTASPQQDGWADLLHRQLSSRVRWCEIVQGMIAGGTKTFIECGAGEVLCGLLKRIDREARGIAVVDGATLDSAAEALS